jgi:hypothetical protein
MYNNSKYWSLHVKRPLNLLDRNENCNGWASYRKIVEYQIS